MMTTPELIIFTDLDGTLLDRDSYSFEPAQPALQLLKEKGIPLILSSSKTRAEIEVYRRRLENNYPFVSENGGAVFIPKSYFPFSFHFDKESDGYLILELGTSYPRIIRVLDSIRKETGIRIKGFFDFAEEEIASLCGLDLKQAKLARKREYDEPFVIEGGKKEIEIVKRKIREKGMNYFRGGRFHHILGNSDKGRVVRILKELYAKECPSTFTSAIGDSPNDLPMLLAAGHPIFLKDEDCLLPEFLSSIPNVIIVNGTGPRAWNEAILSIIGQKSGMESCP